MNSSRQHFTPNELDRVFDCRPQINCPGNFFGSTTADQLHSEMTIFTNIRTGARFSFCVCYTKVESIMVSGSVGRKSVDGHGGAATPGSKSKAKKKSSNPYSTRGLDKYSTLLSELETRRTKIMEKAQGVSMVKFKYSDSDDWIPIVFRGRRDQLDQKHEDGKSTTKQPKSRSETARLDSKIVKAEVSPPAAAAADTAAGRKIADKRMDWRARYYWHLVVVVELFGLVVFGRAFALCCMLMWWYLVPVVHGHQGGSAKWSTKGSARKVSNNNTKINTGASVGLCSYHSATNGV